MSMKIDVLAFLAYRKLIGKISPRNVILDCRIVSKDRRGAI